MAAAKKLFSFSPLGLAVDAIRGKEGVSDKLKDLGSFSPLGMLAGGGKKKKPAVAAPVAKAPSFIDGY